MWNVEDIPKSDHVTKSNRKENVESDDDDGDWINATTKEAGFAAEIDRPSMLAKKETDWLLRL